MATLNDLFDYADIDDVSEDVDGSVELAFTVRPTHTRLLAWGQDLEDATAEAIVMARRDITIHELQSEGLSDEDIDRLAEEYYGPVDPDGRPVWGDDAWERGYEAGIADAYRNGPLAADAIAAARGEPAAAVAAEPYDLSTVGDPMHALERHPLMSVIYAPVAILQLGDNK